MLSMNFFNESKGHQQQDGSFEYEDDGTPKFNLNDPILKAVFSREFPITLKENASVKHIYAAIY